MNKKLKFTFLASLIINVLLVGVLLGQLPNRFDQAAYDRQVATINDLRVQRSKRMAAIVKDIAKALPPEQRNVLVQILKRPPSSR